MKKKNYFLLNPLWKLINHVTISIYNKFRNQCFKLDCEEITANSEGELIIYNGILNVFHINKWGAVVGTTLGLIEASIAC
jgi:hypothetical protein